MIKVWVLVFFLQGYGGASIGDYMSEAECQAAGKALDLKVRSTGKFFSFMSSACIEATRITTAVPSAPPSPPAKSE